MLKIDPSVVLATRKSVDDKAIAVKAYADQLLTAHQQSRNHPDATLTAKGFVKLSNTTDSNSESEAATPRAVNNAVNAAARDAAQKSANLSDLTNKTLAQTHLGIAHNLLPVGVPLPWPTATAPAGWLICNGSTFSPFRYPKLAAVYPAGVWPDLRGEFIRGWDAGKGIDYQCVILSGQDDPLTQHLCLRLFRHAVNGEWARHVINFLHAPAQHCLYGTVNKVNFKVK